MATYLTEQDVQNYGTDLIDVTQRAALHAVAPELQQIKQQNAELQRQLSIEARRNLDARVERAVPNFREVDRDPRWLQWLAGTDALTGRSRQQLLNDAIASTDANRVAMFFRRFQQEAGSVQAPAAAPGRARSAPSGKPVYSHTQIAEFYSQHRKGEWARLEADFFTAQREGRVQGVCLTK
jgi:hypothetical protein